MASSSTVPTTLAGFTTQQFQEILQLLGNAQPPRPQLKVERPTTFGGERDQLRSFLATVRNYFDAITVTNDQERIRYVKSLLRKAAANWITPYVEGKKDETWTTYNELVDALKKQFDDVDATNTARAQLEQMRQGKEQVTDYWTRFSLALTNADQDDGTYQPLFLRGISNELQETWAADSSTHKTVEQLAEWAVIKENKINTLHHIRKRASNNYAKTNTNKRNMDGTFRATSQP